MSERDDVAAELRRLYADLRAPTPADDLAGADPETVRVVGWMRDAYRGLAVPRAESLRVERRPPRALRPVRVAALAAAAGVLALGGAALWRALAPPGIGSGAPVEPPAPRIAARTAEERGIEIRALGPDQVELRSGPVRLVLLGTNEPDPEPGS